MGLFGRKKEYEELKRNYEELKGYYDVLNQENELFKRIYPYTGEMIEFTTFNRDEQKKLYTSVAAVYGIINKIARSVSEIAQYIELQDDEENVINNHWINTLLDMPNDRLSRENFIKAWTAHKLIYGDVFVYCQKSIGSKRNIESMYLVPGNRIAIDSGGWRQPMKGIKITNSGKDENISFDDVWVSYFFNPDADSFFGLSPLVAAAQEVQIIRNGKRRQNASMQNGAVNTLITPRPDQMGLMPKDTDDLDKELNSEKNINRTKYLRQAVDVHKIGSTPVELEILDSTRDSVTALCFVYEIPVDLYYGQSKYENAREARKTLYESIAIPMLQDFCNDFMTYLQRQFPNEVKGLKLYVNKDNIDVLKMSSTENLINLEKIGASLNEKRQAYGYPSIEKPYANEPMLPLGVQFGEMTYDIQEPTE